MYSTVQYSSGGKGRKQFTREKERSRGLNGVLRNSRGESGVFFLYFKFTLYFTINLSEFMLIAASSAPILVACLLLRPGHSHKHSQILYGTSQSLASPRLPSPRVRWQNQRAVTQWMMGRWMGMAGSFQEEAVNGGPPRPPSSLLLPPPLDRLPC